MAANRAGFSWPGKPGKADKEDVSHKLREVVGGPAMPRNVGGCLAALLLFGGLGLALAQETAPLPQSAPADPADKPLPIDLASALQLANARAIDVAVAAERIRLAAAQYDRAHVAWLPTIQLGIDYFRHDGRIQDVQGNIIDTSKSSFMLGAAPNAVFALSDAIFAPLAARQVVQAREAELQASTNDTALSVAEAYFNVQQARGELAGAIDAVRRSEELVLRTTELARDLAPPVEATRARAELARRKQAVQAARERWRVASAELTRILRLDPAAVVEPVEPPNLQVTLVALDKPVDDLIATGLTNRPELTSQQALVRAALQQLRQERVRPLVPSILVRGAATNPAGTLAGGYFGGGINDEVSRFGARGDYDVQVLWQLENLGFGNSARVKERRAEHQLAVLESLRLQDRVAAEVKQASDQVQSAAARVKEAESGLKDAVESVNQNFEGLKQTKRVGNLLVLVIRPQEVAAAVQALALAYGDYYGAIGDFNRAEFRLYRAMGQPAQAILDDSLVLGASHRSEK
ncbi:MAG TPA: TolC family protein [Gemmataceae bacterium]|nr:TolC family protein [Gemmataceae bacterium]